MAPFKASAPNLVYIAALLVLLLLVSSASSQSMSVSPTEVITPSTATATLNTGRSSQAITYDCLAIELTTGASSCAVPSGLPSSGCGSGSTVPTCSGNPPTSLPCIMATQTCTVTYGNSCTLSTPTYSELQLGTYNVCGYLRVLSGGTVQQGGYSQVGSTASFSVIAQSGISSSVQIEPGAYSSGVSEIIPGASANVLVQVSGLPSTTSGEFSGELFVAYFSNVSSPVTPAQDLDCGPLVGGGTGGGPGAPYHPPIPCTPTAYAQGTSCYTNYPSQLSSCSKGTCYISNLTPSFMANNLMTPSQGTGYQACAYYSTTADPSTAIFMGSAPFEITSNAPGFGMGVVPGVFSPGSSVSISVESSTPFLSLSSQQYPISLCNVGNGEVCGIEYAGLEGHASQSDACAAFLDLGSGGSPPFAPPNLNCTFANGALTPYAGDPFFAYYSEVSNSPPCLLSTLPGSYQNQVNGSYTQYMNTQYLPPGNYQFCAYDYMPDKSLPGSPFYSPFFATGQVSCNAITCTVSGTSLPYTQVSCTGNCASVTGGGIGVYSAVQLSTFQNTVCGVYGTINDILLIFALVLMLLAAALYAGASILPVQSRDIARSYAMGFFLVSVIALIIATVSLWLLSVAGNVPVANVIGLCK